jgi:tRNA A37 threonylcarbamoyladenosine synthetase subunit TsaC/SUA5/YrdC
MGPPNVKADAKRIFEVLKAGGIAVMPLSVGYAISSTNPQAMERIFTTKQRGAHKRHAMGGSYELHEQVHIMDPVHADIVHTLVKTLGLTLGVVAKFDRDNAVIRNIDAGTLEAATNGDTMAMLIGAGDLQDELIKLTLAEEMPVMGSSANISGTGLSPRSTKVIMIVLISFPQGRNIVSKTSTPRSSKSQISWSITAWSSGGYMGEVRPCSTLVVQQSKLCASEHAMK